jgi:hypothetical protein
VSGQNLVRDRGAHQRHRLHIPPSPSCSLANGVRNTSSLAYTDSYLALVVTDHDDRPKTKPPPSLENLGHTSNVHDSLVELVAIFESASTHYTS